MSESTGFDNMSLGDDDANLDDFFGFNDNAEGESDAGFDADDFAGDFGGGDSGSEDTTEFDGDFSGDFGGDDFGDDGFGPAEETSNTVESDADGFGGDFGGAEDSADTSDESLDNFFGFNATDNGESTEEATGDDGFYDEVPTSEEEPEADASDNRNGDYGEMDSDELMSAPKRTRMSVDDMYVNSDIGVKSKLIEKTALDAFDFAYIPIANIAITEGRARKTYNIDKLVMSIQNEGLLEPIVVAPTRTEGRFILVAGLRRLLACAKNGMKEIPACINNNISATDITIVEPISNHAKKYTIQEMVSYIEFLKKEKGIESSTLIEHLLDMESGDYNKLMDIIEDDDEKIVGELYGGQLTIQGAYRELEKKRKKTSKDELETARADKVYSNLEEYNVSEIRDSGETTSGNELSDEEIKEIVGSFDNMDLEDVDGEDLRKEGDNVAGFKPHRQDPNDRERLDPKLRKAVLARDNNTCKICEQISGQEYTEVLDVHHIVEVYLGGNDDIDNLITACTCCHKLVHLWGRGDLHVRPFEEMDEAEAKKFKRVIKLGNIIRKGMADRGMKREQLKKMDNAETIGRRLKGSSDQVAG